MTVQKRTLVSLTDIAVLEYQCPHCEARYSLPMDKIDRLTYLCPNCGERWIREVAASNKEADSVVLQQLIRYLKEAQQRDFAAVLSVEIKGLSEE